MESLLDDVATLWVRWLWPLLQFLIGLGLVIFVHEFGHFLAAKWAGIKVEKFSLGFGRRLLGFRRGETEYRLGILPLGGYVQMLGQDDFRPADTAEHDPRSWQAAKVSRRLVVLSAGVAMNVVFAALVFVVVYVVGIRFTAPVVGGVSPGFPAAEVVLPKKVAEAMGVDEARGLRPADRIEALDDEPVRKFRQLAFAAGTSEAGQVFRLTVVRPLGPDEQVRFDVELEPRKDPDAPGEPYVFGIAGPVVVDDPIEHHYAGEERFRKGDLLGEVNGDPRGVHGRLLPLVTFGDEPVTVTVVRGGRRVPVPVEPYLYSKGGRLLDMLGMSARVEVGDVTPGGAAEKAGLRAGDVIAAYGPAEGPAYPRLGEVSEARRGEPTPIRLLRDGQMVTATVTPYRHGGKTIIGILPLPAQQETVVADVAEDSPVAKAGIPAGAVILLIDKKAVQTWPEVFNALKDAAGKQVTIAYADPDGVVGVAEIGKLTKEMFDVEDFGVNLPAVTASERRAMPTPVFRGHPGQALLWGVEDTWEFIAMTYRSLAGLITRRISPKSATGPVGIGAVAIDIARSDAMQFVYFMAMLSVIVAVINFLPLPVLDGGHVVLVLIEKVRGRPLPVKVQAGIQMFGLVLFIGLFIALTFQDILRLIRL